MSRRCIVGEPLWSRASRVLEISRSGCHGRARHNPCARERSNQTLRRRLVEPRQKYPALGLDSLYHMLKPELGCSRKWVHRQLRLAGIVSGRRRACKVTANSRHSYPPAPNLLQRKFSFNQTNQAWGAILPTFPPERAGSIRPSLKTCAPEKLWAMPVLSAPAHP